MAIAHPNTVLGRNFLVNVGGVILGQKTGTISLTMDTVDTTTKDTSYQNVQAKTYKANLYGWEITLNGAYVLSDTPDSARDLIAGTEIATVTCTIGANTYTGKGIVTSLSMNGDMTDIVTFDMTIQGTDALTVPTASSGGN